MSERFEVPEPSAKAVEDGRGPVQREVVSHWPLGRGAPWYLHDHIIETSLHAAYAVDIPGIVKAEVARALRYECRLDDATVSLPRFDREQAEIRIAAYLESRFGEPVPESHCPNADCKYVAGHSGRHMGRDGIEFGADAPGVPRMDRPALTFRPEGKVIPGVPVVFTEAERDFLLAAAQWVLESNQFNTLLNQPHPLVTAARRVVKEAP